MDIVRVDHMAVALSKTFRSPVIILCSAVKLFRRGKKDTTIAELNKSYLEFYKMAVIPPMGILEIFNMCRVLSDQGLLKLGQSKDEKSRRVTLKVDEADISFALQILPAHGHVDIIVSSLDLSGQALASLMDKQMKRTVRNFNAYMQICRLPKT
ncbi:Cdc6, C-terminal [Dillenia turbinata]|uniref:Cdc6, C-terminal n=1 Tax=Dillenia turbinata TaxID=194707 RepID=A0AAN8ZB28_9MAGN